MRRHALTPTHPRRNPRSYLRLIAGRATGAIQTGSAWQRSFVLGHPDYRGDGVVTSRVAYDLLARVEALATGAATDAALLGPLAPAVEAMEAALRPADTAAAPAAATATPANVPVSGGSHALAEGVAARHRGAASAAVASVPMRGRSFMDEVMATAPGQNAALRTLLERYTVAPGAAFVDAPAFFS